MERFPAGGPKALWRVPLGTGYSGPAVSGGKVYVMDRKRAVDADGKPIRPSRQGVPGTERLVCLDQATGKLLWEHVYDCPYKMSYGTGPRVTPLVEGSKVYALGGMGDLLCVEKETGKVIWSKKLLEDYQAEAPAWGFAAHPLIEGDLIICLVGGEGSAVVAFNKHTGKEAWRKLTTQEIGYSPPMIHVAGGKRQLIAWLSESLNSLNPSNGEVYWSIEYPEGGKPERPAVNIIPAMGVNQQLFISTYYHGPLLVQLEAAMPAAKILWRGRSNNVNKPDGIHSLMAAPVFKDGYIYGCCANGELRCLDGKTGREIWHTFKATCGKKTDCAMPF